MEKGKESYTGGKEREEKKIGRRESKGRNIRKEERAERRMKDEGVKWKEERGKKNGIRREK